MKIWQNLILFDIVPVSFFVHMFYENERDKICFQPGKMGTAW